MATTRQARAGSERPSGTAHDDNPAAVYRDSLSKGSYWAVHHSLVTIAELLGGEGTDPWTFPWWELEYRHTARVRRDLVDRYAPATVNKMLTVLRGVLKTCWRLGLVDAETYRRAADVANVRAKTLPAGRGVERDEVVALLEVCTADPSPAGRRDGALVAILYGAGLRRAEVCSLDLADFEATGCALTVRAGKGRRDRQAFLTRGACQLVRAWVTARGEDDGPLFCPVDTADRPESARSALYRNRGDLRFEDVTEGSGLAHPGWGMGLCAADYDGDGHPDLYVTNVGENRLYRNRGDGSFEEVSETAGVEAGGWSTGCGFADYDRDGDVDLFVSRYVEVDLDNLPEFGKDKTCQYRGIAVQCGPRGLPGTGDLLYRNDGDGTFTEVGEAAGVSDPDGLLGLGIAWFDADGDGWLDLYVANDSTANQFYLNQRDGTFEETAFLSGVAVSEDGGEQGGMGVAVGDYDGSGRPSLLVTNFAEEYNAFYKNEGDYFTDVSFRTLTGAPSLPYVGWGTAFLDYDNDGWLDLFIANGHVYPQLDNAKLGASAPYRQRRLLYRNLGGGTFEEIGEAQGEVLTEPRVSRGVAMGDLNRDGRLDLVINDLDGAPQVLINQAPDPGHWLLVKLVGRAPNTSAIGATARLTTGAGASARTQLRSVRSGTSYLSQDSFRLHFGLGAAKVAQRLVVTWPDGTTTVLTDVAADREIVVRQGEGEGEDGPDESSAASRGAAAAHFPAASTPSTLASCAALAFLDQR